MDQCDRAESEVNMFRKAAISKGLKRKIRRGLKSFIECIDCGDEIPEARRKAVPGCIRCVECEALNEERKNV